MPLQLLIAIACLALWILAVFIRPVGLGIVHLLLVIGAVLWIRWWAMKPAMDNGQQAAGNGQPAADR